MNLNPVKIIAVDFDGTLCMNRYPEIGDPMYGTIAYLLKEKERGAKLILWTCRTGDLLQKAVSWCKERGLIFDAVNENLPEIINSFGSDTRKIFANEYIDDRNALSPKNYGVADILYLCDGAACGDICPGAECKHTSNIFHAKNFVKGDYGSYWEKESVESEPKWIYNPVNDPLWDSLFERIEDALGFKLFFWQKTYIMGLGYRCSGRTTAEVLKNLVGERTAEPIYLKRPKNRMEDFYQHELIEIKGKLDDKGIISRSIERRKQ